MYGRISNKLKNNAFSNRVYSCLWWVLYFILCMFIISFFYYLGRPNLLSEESLSKVKDIIAKTRLAGGVISRRMVVSIVAGVIKANCPPKLNLLEVV